MLKHAFRWLVAGLMAASLAPARAADAEVPYPQRPEVQAFIAGMVGEHGFAAGELRALLGHAVRQQPIIDAISRPAEKARPWKDYRSIFMTEARIDGGVRFWNEQRAVLERAEQVYGVAPEIIVATIGVETMYGTRKGTWRVLDALATLAFDYPPRAEFFRRELAQFLLLVREEQHAIADLTGSYAGAMGIGQFMPSSFRAYAVDFDRDGRRDIWNDPADAIGSVANYYQRHRWQRDGRGVLRIAAPTPAVDALVTTALAPDTTVAALAAAGVPVEGLAPDTPVAVYRMDGADGPEYWVGLPNFEVITRYNRSSMYALAVLQLAEAIRDRRAGATAG